MTRREHWESVYAGKAATEVSWYQPHALRSMQLIRDAGVPASAAIVDIGGGASTLVDDLVAAGFDKVTVMDISGAALAIARARLGPASDRVRWIESDVLEYPFPGAAFDVWHDRAVFHFLTHDEDRRAYVEAARRALKAGGILIVATFADDGPTRCSGLPVMRYDANALQAAFGPDFETIACDRHVHRTPAGVAQSFVQCALRKTH
jgi:ubiquinone/menaquinone biosynthesis C-methylase UbiE